VAYVLAQDLGPEAEGHDEQVDEVARVHEEAAACFFVLFCVLAIYVRRITAESALLDARRGRVISGLSLDARRGITPHSLRYFAEAGRKGRAEKAREKRAERERRKTEGPTAFFSRLMKEGTGSTTGESASF